MKVILTVVIQFIIILPTWSQSSPPDSDGRLYDIVKAVSADRIEKDIRTLVGFGTRNTLSDTVSTTRGIGAAVQRVRAPGIIRTHQHDYSFFSVLRCQ